MIQIEQALYGNREDVGYRVLARSPGFRDDWLSEAQSMCSRFGERPAGIACQGCLFVQPVGKGFVAIVQVADQGEGGAGRPGALGFHLLVLSRAHYAQLDGDPFLIADQFAPPWSARDVLPAVVWPELPVPRRTVAEVQRILKRAEGPSLLGAAQILIDGGRLRFDRPAPDTELIRDLWGLLPASTRNVIWPASFSFGLELGCHAVVVPSSVVPDSGYVTEEQAADYPEGRYELNLQIAAEASDQRELDALFARRSRAETWRLGLILLGFITLVVLIANWASPRPVGETQRTTPTIEQLDLPADHYPRLTQTENDRLGTTMRTFVAEAKLGALPPDGTPEALLDALDDRLGVGVAGRDPGANLTSGPIQRRLRALLWKHGVVEYRESGLNAVELVERLQRKWMEEKR